MIRGSLMRNADYLALISATVVSSIRLLKPHSLWLRNEWGTAPHHFAFIRATVVSSIRLLKPYSLGLRPGA